MKSNLSYKVNFYTNKYLLELTFQIYRLPSILISALSTGITMNIMIFMLLCKRELVICEAVEIPIQKASLMFLLILIGVAQTLWTPPYIPALRWHQWLWL